MHNTGTFDWMWQQERQELCGKIKSFPFLNVCPQRRTLSVLFNSPDLESFSAEANFPWRKGLDSIVKCVFHWSAKLVLEAQTHTDNCSLPEGYACSSEEQKSASCNYNLLSRLSKSTFVAEKSWRMYGATSQTEPLVCVNKKESNDYVNIV